MPERQATFANNVEAAHAIYRYLNSVSPTRDLGLRPYNRFAPAFTEWWFTPDKTEWPTYHRSKLFVHRTQPPVHEREGLYVGFYVEKGLGKPLARMTGVKNAYIMENDWYWHQFLRHAQASRMNSTISEVLTRSELPVVLSMNVHEFNHVPEPDTERPRPHDWIEFTVSDSMGALELAVGGRDILAQLDTCASLNELAHRLQILQGLDYFWLNLLVGVRLMYGPGPGDAWGAAELWHNTLEPWCPWIG